MPEDTCGFLCCHNRHASNSGCLSEQAVRCCQGKAGANCKREVCGVVVREVVGPRQGRQFENLSRSLPRRVNGKSCETREETAHLV